MGLDMTGAGAVLYALADKRGDDLEGEALTEQLDRAATVAFMLMGGRVTVGVENQVQGYTFANALNAACETGGITSVIRVAMVAERLARLRDQDLVRLVRGRGDQGAWDAVNALERRSR